jgi:hypothetical protein
LIFVTFQICSDTDTGTGTDIDLDRIIGNRIEAGLAGIAVGSDAVGINTAGITCCGVGRGAFRGLSKITLKTQSDRRIIPIMIATRIKSVLFSFLARSGLISINMAASS